MHILLISIENVKEIQSEKWNPVQEQPMDTEGIIR
jgi:hypothetical protein